MSKVNDLFVKLAKTQVGAHLRRSKTGKVYKVAAHLRSLDEFAVAVLKSEGIEGSLADTDRPKPKNREEVVHGASHLVAKDKGHGSRFKRAYKRLAEKFLDPETFEKIEKVITIGEEVAHVVGASREDDR